MIILKTKGINAFNPLQNLIRNKEKRILNWKDLDLTQDDVNLLTDDQRKKLLELAKIKIRQLQALNDEKNEKIEIDETILNRKDEEFEQNLAFEQNDQLEQLQKKWEKIEKEIEKQNIQTKTLEKLHNYYKNNLPNLLLDNKKRERKAEKMKKYKELAKVQRAQLLFLTRRQQFEQQLKQESELKQKKEEKNKQETPRFFEKNNKQKKIIKSTKK